jgi:hypothetical protein
LWVVVACAAGSATYVLAKAASVLPRHATTIAGPEGMLLLSLALDAAHVAVAYRTSCRERRRQLVYRIDAEAVSTLCPPSTTNPLFPLPSKPMSQ